jgi:hypothetical protein
MMNANRLLAVVCLLLIVTRGHATDVVITSFQGNGSLTWSNTNEFSHFKVEWAPTADGPWTHSWENLVEIANTGDTHSVSVPMFYRVVGFTWPDSTFLLHADGTDGSTSFTDVHGHTLTAIGDTHVSSNESVFGGASARFDGNDDLLCSASSPDWGFGTNDFTIDLRIRFTSLAGVTHIIGLHEAYVAADWILSFDGASLRFHAPPANIGVTWAPSLDTWYHIAVTREKGYARFFVDGNLLGGEALNQDIGSNYLLSIGASENLYVETAGYIDEVRIINGRAAWTTDFIPPKIPYAR